jgi:predicted transcriptional regulator of viral defense system
MAAVLAYGPAALASHQTAGAIWQMRSHSRATVDVTAPVRGRRSVAGVKLHQVRRLHAGGGTGRDGIPVTTVARTLLDLAEVLRPDELRRVLEEAERLRLLDMRAVDGVLARSHGRHGVKPLAALMHL